MPEIRLGYACLNTALRKMKGNDEVHCSRNIRLKTIFNLPGNEATAICQKLCLQNIRDLLTIIKWNEEHNIRFFRITSELLPHVGNPIAIKHFPNESYFKGDLEFAESLLKEVGDFARKYDHRLTFHSNPYVQLGSPNKHVLDHSLVEIDLHYCIFKMMGIKGSPLACLILHGGGVFGDINATIERIVHNLKTLVPPEQLSMLVFENDEWHYNPLHLLPICEEFGLGFCFDIFHNRVSRSPIPVTRSLLKRIIASWGDYPPKMHLSQQKPGERRGAHSDIITRLPGWLATEIHVPRLDLMLECKLKEQSVLLLQPALEKPPFKS